MDDDGCLKCKCGFVWISPTLCLWRIYMYIRVSASLSYRFTRCQGFFYVFDFSLVLTMHYIFFLNAKQAIINQSLRRIFFLPILFYQKK